MLCAKGLETIRESRLHRTLTDEKGPDSTGHKPHFYADGWGGTPSWGVSGGGGDHNSGGVDLFDPPGVRGIWARFFVQESALPVFPRSRPRES